MHAPADTAPADELQQLLEATYGARHRRLPRRELLVEAGLTVFFLAATATLIALAPSLGAPGPAVALVVLAYVVAGRVNFPLGTGNLVPTQPFLVALFALSPSPYVPLLVFSGLLGGAFLEVALGRLHRERLVFTGANAMHALGPAVVLQVGGAIDAHEAGALLIVAAFGSQVAIDLLCSIAREWLSIGLRPQVQARVVAHICVVDAALTPLGVLAVAAGGTVLTALALLPLVGLFSYTARERLRATERAHERLVALERERRRLRVAVERIGEAFASNLDLDALLQIVTRASVEALDGRAGRASSWPGAGRALRRRASVTETAELAPLIDTAEIQALETVEPAAVAYGGRAALAAPLVVESQVLGVVTIARPGDPFDEDQQALFVYLCEQAAIAARNVTRHEALHRQALTDELTGLANHRRFQELLTAAVERRQESGRDASLILLDIDDFKAINDLHGHQVGDTVLRAVGRALRDACRTTDEPARYGGEELAILLPDTPLEIAAEFAERIRREIEEVEVLGPHGEHLHVTVSGGVAALGDAVRTKAALIAAADNALYRAKAGGKNRIEVAVRTEASVAPLRPFVPRQAGAVPARVALEGDLRRALDEGELFLQYQPIVRLATGGLAGVEALVRWRHPTRGILPPAEFVPLAERRGLIVPLGEWVLEEACRQGAAWAQRWPGLFVGVNVSLPQLTEQDFPQQVARVLDGTGLPPNDLVLELTESVLMHDVEAAIDRLAVVRALGPRIAVDDFGTGHSSLQYLQRLPLDVVKVPETFVRGLEGDASGRVLTRTIIDLAHRLGLAVVAEGVERREQLAQLEDAGAELAQGFLFAPALDPGEFEALLAAPAEVGVAVGA